ncbi:hypothetical protein QBC46DRAFT_277620 [Diplogelasinospora grovesii]|uniref:N-acetyltransferase domain-containing protein n=1 Tax=Diplogelasinospora grovesii TaxID=303347 RepID=A0AAN6S8Q1_9PEZI|nr:hypothetical protein QBC46DRAFT_277620 [Diplogelasinospora grovesii]
MAAAGPRIRIRDAVPADAGAITEINYAAFGPDIMDKLMYPNGVSDNARRKFESGLFAPKHPSAKGETIIKVAELLPVSDNDGPGEVVAFSKWVLYREPRPEAEWNVEHLDTAETLGEGVNVDVYNNFFGAMHRKRRQWAKGDPVLFLAILACTPTRHRLGAGTAMVRWGTELADELGLPSMLEASPSGYGLYKKFGYEDIDVIDLNITERWGAAYDGRNWGKDNAVELAGPAPEGVSRTVVMRRPAKAKSSTSTSMLHE